MTDTHGQNIESMFDRISPRYDLLNRVLSGGSDIRWRRKAVALLGNLQGKTALDLCCGSGDFLQILDKKNKSNVMLIGSDFADKMLRIAAKRLSISQKSTIGLCRADAQYIPLTDKSVNAVTIGFGIRNVTDKAKSLSEIYRVLAPGGRLVIIEPSIPRSKLIALFFSLYFGKIMPFIGGLISGDYQAYKYLNDSVEAFPAPEIFCGMLSDAGFLKVKSHPQLLGTAMIYFAQK